MSKTAAVGLSTQQIVQALVQQVKAIELAPRPQERVSSGSPDLDRILPDRGFARGSLVEWLSPAAGSGASSLALRSSLQACGTGQALVIVDRVPCIASRQQTFYLPGAVSWGIDPQQLVIVRPASDAEEAWAIDQILRCPAVGVVLCWPRRSDDHTYRRWQLAAEEGDTLGFLVRDVSARSQPSWAELRLLVEPVRVSKQRNNHGGAEGTEAERRQKGAEHVIPSAARNLASTKILRCAQDDTLISAPIDSSPCPPCLRGSHSAEAQSFEQTLARRLRVQVLRCRWGEAGRSAEILLGEESTSVRSEGAGA